jgi:hypothetical protein
MSGDDMGAVIEPDDMSGDDMGVVIEPDDMSGDDMDVVIEPDDMSSEDAPVIMDDEVALVIGVVEPAEDAVGLDEPQATSTSASAPPAAAAEIFLSNMS